MGRFMRRGRGGMPAGMSPEMMAAMSSRPSGPRRQSSDECGWLGELAITLIIVLGVAVAAIIIMAG